MPTRAQPKVTTLNDNVAFNSTTAVEDINRNNEVIQMKFGALTADDLSTASTTFLSGGSIDMGGNLITNVKECVNFINLREDGRSLETIVANETSPVIFIEPNYTYEVTKKVVLKSDVQIVGGGPSSVLNMSSVTAGGTGGFSMFEVTASTKRWALRSFRMSGKRGNGLTGGRPLLVTGCTNADGEIDSVWMGPLIDGATTVAFHSGPIISGSSGIRFTNVQVRKVSNIAMFVGGSCKNIEFKDCAVEQNSSTAFQIVECSSITIRDSWVGENGGTNFNILRSSHIIFANNNVYNASTASGGTDDGVFILGTANTKVTGLIFMGNVFADKNVPRTTNRHIRVGANATYLTFMFNHFNSTTGDGGHISYATARSSMVVSQDKNSLHGGYKFLPNSDANKVTYQDWKNMDYAHPYGTPVAGVDQFGDVVTLRNLTRTYGNNVCDPGDNILTSSRGFGRTVDFNPSGGFGGGPIPQVRFGFGAGLSDDASYPDTSKIVDRMGNRGSLLTPERLETGNAGTNMKDEVGAVIATYNLGPQTNDVGEVVGTPNAPRNNADSANLTSLIIFPQVGAGTGGMKNSVLVAHFTGVTNLEVLSHPYDVDMANTTTVLLGRPTWVSVKV